ncbi:hypothetical protein EDB84DRAFT_1437471 [Lactarius hengduanensis]|nr:hypothetical protein EDB84DRAFT_1437471 [Lactarius hengduanensis]
MSSPPPYVSDLPLLGDMSIGLRSMEGILLLFVPTRADCPRRTSAVADWLRRFYVIWSSVQLMVRLSRSVMGPEIARVLSEVKEWAEPYATVDWVRLFPEIAGGLCDRLTLHAGVVSRAQTRVINIFMLGRMFGNDVPDAYALARQDFIEFYRTAVITLEELDWHVFRLESERQDAALERTLLCERAGLSSAPLNGVNETPSD